MKANQMMQDTTQMKTMMKNTTTKTRIGSIGVKTSTKRTEALVRR